MIDTLQIYEELKDEITPSAAKKIAEAIGKVYSELLNTVTKEEFKELRETVAGLAEAQKSAEVRLTRLEETVAGLAEAQKSAEVRLTRLEKTVAELTEAQKNMEVRLTRLEKTVTGLAEAQKRTEEELRKLVIEHRKTREQVGGLTHTVGYILEDRAYRGLPELLRKDFGIEIITPLKRDYIEFSPGRYEEVNIMGRGRRNGQEIFIIGECKTQLKKADIDAFIRFIKKAENIFPEERILLAVTYQASPPVRKYAEQKGIKLYFSYEMPL